MIEKLTSEQIAKFSEYVEKWKTVGLCTKRANRQLAEKYCREAYKVAGLSEPKFIFWAQSPIGLLLTAKLIKELAAKGYAPYAAAEGGEVRAQVRDQVWDQVRDQVRATSLRSEWNELYSYGQHDAGWLSFYSYFNEVCGLEKETQKLQPLINLSKETGWQLFYKDIAFLSEKPTEIHLNERGQLHNFNGQR